MRYDDVLACNQNPSETIGRRWDSRCEDYVKWQLKDPAFVGTTVVVGGGIVCLTSTKGGVIVEGGMSSDRMRVTGSLFDSLDLVIWSFDPV